MSASSHAGRYAHVADHRWDSAQFRFIFAIAFVPFLVTAAGRRLAATGRGARRSIFAEAWEAAGTTAQLAFAG